MSNRTSIKCPRVAPGGCKVHIYIMYIKYTLLFVDYLASFPVLQVLGEVALPVTFSLAIKALHASIGTRFSGLGLGNQFALPPGLPALLSLATGFLKIDGLVDHQQRVLLLDLHLSSLEHHEYFPGT